jgi:hypothetical protein
MSLALAQAKTRGRTGWTIRVVSPPSAWRAERQRFVQSVMPDALVVDVALAVVGAIERGDHLWTDD